MSDVQWTVYDRNDKAGTTPPSDRYSDDLVWIVEEFYEGGGVTIGFFDGYTWRTWAGSDDCSVSAWAPIAYPEPPKASVGEAP